MWHVPFTPIFSQSNLEDVLDLRLQWVFLKKSFRINILTALAQFPPTVPCEAHRDLSGHNGWWERFFCCQNKNLLERRVPRKNKTLTCVSHPSQSCSHNLFLLDKYMLVICFVWGKRQSLVHHVCSYRVSYILEWNKPHSIRLFFSIIAAIWMNNSELCQLDQNKWESPMSYVGLSKVKKVYRSPNSHQNDWFHRK